MEPKETIKRYEGIISKGNSPSEGMTTEYMRALIATGKWDSSKVLSELGVLGRFNVFADGRSAAQRYRGRFSGAAEHCHKRSNSGAHYGAAKCAGLLLDHFSPRLERSVVHSVQPFCEQ